MAEQACLRILFLGETWWGSCARACWAALRRQGHLVRALDETNYFPQWETLEGRLARRVIRPLVVREYNHAVLSQSREFDPDIVFVFKGTFLLPQTVDALRRQRAIVINYYPDPSLYIYGGIIPNAIYKYDYFVTTKKYHLRDLGSRFPEVKLIHIPHGYDADLHRPVTLAGGEANRYGSDVAFVGTWTRQKQLVLEELVRKKPDIRLRVWGNGWHHAVSGPLRPILQGKAAHGDEYPKVICGTKVNLAIMSGKIDPEHHAVGDLTSTRTFEIPACGGFMLHERNEEVRELFEEEKEVVCFASVDELGEKIDYYLKHESERDAIARAGYERCMRSEYSYDDRMRELIGTILKESAGKV